MFRMLASVVSKLFRFCGLAADAAARPARKNAHTKEVRAACKKARQKKVRAKAVLTASKKTIEKRAQAEATAEQNANGKRAWAEGCTEAEHARDCKIFEDFCDLGMACSFGAYRRRVLARAAAKKPC